METRHRSLFISLFSILLMFMYGCSTLTTGSSQSVTVNTDPTGATCTLSRKGASIAIVNPTPGTVTVDKSKDDISVLCKKDGFQDGAGVFDSKFQGMTFGNILFGGLIGLAIDAGSGAINKYPSMITVGLIPTEFKSISESDAFFDKMKADCIADIQKKTEQVNAVCSDIGSDQDKKEACTLQKKALEEERTKSLSDIERKRAAAKIRS